MSFHEYVAPHAYKRLAFYNITAPTKAAAGNQLGIFEDLNDKYSQTDLNEFFLALSPYALPANLRFRVFTITDCAQQYTSRHPSDA